MDGGTLLESFRGLIDSRLSVILPPAGDVPEVLHEAMRYCALAPGKRLRPALAMASAEAVGGTALQALDQACALELVHCFSLIHDDLPAIDDDDLRRGLPTCHKVYGEAVAILAGDALFALAFEVMANSPPAVVSQAVLLLAQAAGTSGLVGGEVLDILAEGVPPDRALLETIHSRKTGALIAASCEIGALIGGGTPRQVQTLRTFGEEIGLAFQIADDILNETSTAAELGKAVGSDRARGKLTYPSVIGLPKSNLAAQSAMAQAMQTLDSIENDTTALRALAAFAVKRKK